LEELITSWVFQYVDTVGTGGGGGGGGISDADYGDVTVSSSATVWTIDNLAITNAKINDVAWSKITSVPDAVADGSTKGIASFNASDFNSTSGNISIDYTNAPSSSASVKGFLTSTDWSAFDAKNNLTATYVGYGDGSGKLTGSTNLTFDGNIFQLGAGSMTYPATKGYFAFSSLAGASLGVDLDNTSATGSIRILMLEGAGDYGGFFKFNSSYGGSYTGTSVPLAGSFQIQSGSGNDHPFVISSSSILWNDGTASGNLAIRISSAGFKIGTNNDLQTDGGTAFQTTAFAAGYVAKTANYTATASDYTIDCTSGTFTVTLPTAVGCAGRIYVVKNSGTGVITIATTSSQTIDGSATQTLSTQYASLGFQSNGGHWIIVN
jgi:hypothetical protein